MDIDEDLLKVEIDKIINDETLEKIKPSEIRRKLEKQLNLPEYDLDCKKTLIKEIMTNLLNNDNSGDENKSGISPVEKKRKRKNNKNHTKNKKIKVNEDQTSDSPKKTKESTPVDQIDIGLFQLKKMVKAMGIGPSVYRGLKEIDRSEQITKLRQQITEYGGIIKGEYPTDSEINKAKRRKEKAMELDGLDLNNIISGKRRSRKIVNEAKEKSKTKKLMASLKEFESSGDEASDGNNDGDDDGDGDEGDEDDDGNDKDNDNVEEDDA